MKVGTPPYAFRVEIDENACAGCAVYASYSAHRVVVQERGGFYREFICMQGCLSCGSDVRMAIKVVAEKGSFEQAWRTFAQTHPMPAVTGRVCHHPCESQCNRTHLDEPVNVNQFEKCIADYGLSLGACI